jgi:hypothetical protein
MAMEYVDGTTCAKLVHGPRAVANSQQNRPSYRPQRVAWLEYACAVDVAGSLGLVHRDVSGNILIARPVS